MGRGLGSNTGLSSTFKKRISEAKAEAKANMIKFGGDWYVIRIGDAYTSVHSRYLKTHRVRPLFKAKSEYGFKEAWYKRMLIPIINWLTKLLLRWQNAK